MPSLSRLDDPRSGKSLIRMLALFLALAVEAPLLLAQDSDHDRDADHGRFVDPIVGSWIVHVTVTSFISNTNPPSPTPPVPFDFDNLAAFLENGITINSDSTQGTGYGVWKRVGRFYYTKFLTIVPSGQGYPPGTINTVFGDGTMLQGNQMTGPFHGFDTDPNTKMIIDQFAGTVVVDRITFQSTP
jgi:hypothetical protein